MAAWYGSKATTGLRQAIVSLMPPHDVFPESHLGGGAIMKRKPPALRNIGIDLNRRALDGFRRDHPVELHHGCATGWPARWPPLRESGRTAYPVRNPPRRPAISR